MASPTTTSTVGRSAKSERHELDTRRREYRYLPPEKNLLAPIAICEHVPLREQHPLDWVASFMPRYLAIGALGKLHAASEAFQRATFRFDKIDAFRQLLGTQAGDFVEQAHNDEAFAARRVAGANPIVIRQELDLEGLRRTKIPFDVDRVERWMEAHRPRHWKGTTSIKAAAEEGRLFVVDFEILKHALPEGATRDSRWRGKYLATPIAVFIGAPGFHASTDLVPVAIQIDQPQPEGEHNPVYYPDDGWGWQIAKIYVESADTQHHLSCGHAFRHHLIMEAFCIATPRHLPTGHPVQVLLEPHMQMTLTTNSAVYENFTERNQLYFEFYSGTLEEMRNIALACYRDTSFRELRFKREIERRNVLELPVDYPYRHDGLHWLEPIHRFVKSYVHAHFDDDGEVQGDAYLQAWAKELADPHRGAIRDLVKDGRLDSRKKLIQVLEQVLFTAGPGHASMHYGGNEIYRYAPAMPSAAMLPPPTSPEQWTRARYLRTLPTVDIGRDQWVSANQGSFRWGRFGHYDGFALNRDERSEPAIRRLQDDLDELETKLREKIRARVTRYDVWLPSLVPNSINL